MAKIVSLYSQPISSVSGDAQYLVRSFRVQRNPAALAVTISWSPPLTIGEVTLIRLVRKTAGQPENAEDGAVVHEGLPGATAVVDEDVQDGTCYYYSMFSLHVTHGWLVGPETEGNAIPAVSGFHADRLFFLLDQAYVLADKRLDRGGTDQLALSREEDPETHFVYNREEDGTKKKGPLRRFLKIFAAELDLIHGLIRGIAAQRDVDKVCADFLPHMGTLVGAVLNRELPAGRQREEIKRTVASYRVRGTVPGLRAKVRAVSGLDSVVDEDFSHLLCSNCADRTSPEFSPAEAPDIGLDGDLIYYSSSDEFSWLTFGLFFILPLDELLTRGTAEKLVSILCDFSPVCRTARPIVLNGLKQETLAAPGDSLSGGLSRVREDMADLGDSLASSSSIAGPDVWLHASLDDADDLTNNVNRITAMS